MYHVYKIGNTVNDKLYVGLTGNIENRWKTHQQLGRAPAARYANKPLYVAMREYGIDKFFIEPIEAHPDWEYMVNREQYWIRRLSALHPNGYNWTARKLSDEEAAIIRYDAYGKTSEEYAALFGISKFGVIGIQGNADSRPYRDVGIEDLPAHLQAKRFPPTYYGPHPHYVYTYANSLTGTIFHAGIGKGEEMFQVIQEAAEAPDRNSAAVKTIRSIWRQGGKVLVRKPYKNLAWDEATRREKETKKRYDLYKHRKLVQQPNPTS